MFQEWRGQTIPSLLRYGAGAWPDRIAVDDGREQLTYAALAQRSDRMQEALVQLGIKRGDHVAYLLPSGIRWLEILFAASALGAVLVPLNLTWTSEEITQGLTLTDTNVLLVAGEHRGASLIERIQPLIDRGSSGIAPALRQIVLAQGHADRDDLTSLEHQLALASPQAPDKDSGPVAPGDNAMLILTSGSTSFPKPAIHTHESVLCGSAGYADGLEACADDIFLHCMPNYHVGSIATACLTLMRGARLELMSFFEPGEALRRIHSSQATLFWGFDTHFLMMRDHPDYAPGLLSSLQRTMVAANPATFEKVRGMGLKHIGSLYGSTEYMGSQTYFPFRDRADEARMKASNGRATSGEIRIARLEGDGWATPGELGEICARGPALFKGYYRQPEASAACMDAEGFFHSGDLGFLDEDGYLYYRGRLKEMIKSGGENVSALEVETFLLAEIPGVVRAMICATPHPKWGEAVTALLEVEAGRTYSAEDIQALCRNRLAGYKIPKRVLFLASPDWPITPTGKLDRRALATRASTHYAHAADSEPTT
ncbi:MAG: class I adenylate-forming enzyme family protein [Castellaniella sp.]|uniref:class I adenylate-forming enzyme family protein n=1 Tax=Castellaniella sp. TaxID=1955812 RepID=UPI003C78DEBD